jgi:hypothetical protein
MATYAAGVTATWNGTSFGEVQKLTVTHGGSLPLARASTWTLDVGTIEIECLHTANISTTNYGKRGTVTIAGGGLGYTGTAVLEKFTLAGAVNDGQGDVSRYTVTLRVQG